MRGSKPTIVIGSLILIDTDKKKGPIWDDMEKAVSQAAIHYSRHFPVPEHPIIQIHPETAETYGVNGSVSGVAVVRDKDVPHGYIWYLEAGDIGLHASTEGAN